MSDVVYTTGYPRSGTWWITRLLSDLLDSPIRNLPPDSAAITDFCQTGLGGYTILKTHLRADEWDGDGKVVFIQRDPRDVAVSAAFYLGISLSDTIENMCIKSGEPFDVKRHIYHKPGWYKEFVQGWLDCPSAICVKYEELHTTPGSELYNIGVTLAGDVFRYKALDPQSAERIVRRIERTIDRQRFDQHQHKYPHAMRKGVVGDWRNHLEARHLAMIDEHLGEMMRRMGYE